MVILPRICFGKRRLWYLLLLGADLGHNSSDQQGNYGNLLFHFGFLPL